MALILPFGDHRPRLGRGVFVAPNATLIGDVILADEASVWFGAVLRGDIGSIRVGPRSNVQDLSCVHLTQAVSNTEIGADCTVGHGVILHGCTIGDRCLIGMGSILLDNVVVGDDSLIAAGSVVTPKTVIPPRSLVRGAPAKIIRQVTPEEMRLGPDGAAHYLVNARRFLAICGSAEEAVRFRRGEDHEDLARTHAARKELEAADAIEADARRARALDLGSDRDANED